MQKELDRSLYMATTLIIVVAALLGMMVIPHVLADSSPHATPDTAVPVIRFFMIAHLLVAAAFAWTIIRNLNGVPMSPGLLLLAGLALILFGVLLVEGAFTYRDHPNFQGTSVAMLVGVGCDFIAGIIALRVRSKVTRMSSHG